MIKPRTDFVSGHFNILHPRHLRLLRSAKEYGERLIFAIESDRMAGVAAHLPEKAWPMKYQIFVGDRGIRLSGGQRKLIGFTPALYKQSDVIMFDEATSALDNQTEKDVMGSIESLSDDLTLIIIAHRLTTLKNCTQIVGLGDGGIKLIGNYEDIVNKVA